MRVQGFIVLLLIVAGIALILFISLCSHGLGESAQQYSEGQKALADAQVASQPMVRPHIPWEEINPFKFTCLLRPGESSADFHIRPNHWAKMKVSDWGKPGVRYHGIYDGRTQVQPKPDGDLPDDEHVSYFSIVNDSSEPLLFTVEESRM